MSAPTEAEIREAVRYRLAIPPTDDPAGNVLEGIQQMADFMYGPSADVLTGERARGLEPRGWPADLWDDLRRTEAARLDQLYREATKRALARCLEIATEELVIAGETFAREYPDAPRGMVREAVA